MQFGDIHVNEKKNTAGNLKQTRKDSKIFMRNLAEMSDEVRARSFKPPITFINEFSVTLIKIKREVTGDRNLAIDGDLFKSRRLEGRSEAETGVVNH